MAASIKLAPASAGFNDNCFDKVIEHLKDGAINIKNVITGDIDLFPEYQKYQKNFNILKNLLSSFINRIKDRPDRQFVFIIDELDRCKPTFAIQTLEVVKHLFDVENIVFIFAVDVNELSYSINSVYGQNFDSTGYLCRFFDYISQMPSPDVHLYIAKLFTDRDADSKIAYESDISKKVVNLVLDLTNGLNLSLRDLQTIAQSYKIMFDMFLSEYDEYQAYCLYLYFMILKYKKPDIFSGIFVTKKYNSFTTLESLDNCFNYLNPIERYVCDKQYLPMSNTPLKSVNFNVNQQMQMIGVGCVSIENNSLIITKNSAQGMKVTQLMKEIKMDSSVNCNHLLYMPDLKKWDNIKDLSFLTYVHQQLEVFNFTPFRDAAEDLS